ncbi:hypothetical protein D5072_15485 [Dickeya dianthicola]|uniref:Uncharacterized protein n=1 Tax=Dickeya dianthicola TaxID=204039 RepID=A0ABX9NTH4_9GAMM|nr:hypothetical protein D5072_15485 [Dickeya dianthicola]RJL76468.1 hypothetical protein D5077_00225 [Dickeya dianthicola]
MWCCRVICPSYVKLQVRWPSLFTPVSYFCKPLDIHSLAALQGFNAPCPATRIILGITLFEIDCLIFSLMRQSLVFYSVSA